MDSLFHDDLDHVQQNVEYAAWLNASVIRFFATDKVCHANLSVAR
jgi:hypothetical protein